ncbi:MAG: VLRF1 family aeRF1-type release factor [Actinomycetes bacterium]
MIDETLLQSLTDFTDDEGVLSFYVGVTPAQAADPRPTTPLEVRAGIDDLRASLDGDGRAAVQRRLEELNGDLEELTDPKSSGRGRALFVGVSSGRTEQVHLQMPFRTRVLFDERPYVRPLVAAYDEGRPAGIAVVHAKGARLLEWGFGEATEVFTRDFELTDAQTADVKSGPSPNNPNLPGGGNVNKERYEDRIDENRHRFLKSFLDELVTTADEHGWDRLVVAGAPKLRDDVVATLQRDHGRQALLAEHAWEQTPPHEVATQVWDTLRAASADRAIELVERCIDRAKSGGAGALGDRDVCAAANEGRISHLLFQTDLSLEGFRSEAGTLHVSDDGAMGESDVAMHPEPLLVDRLVQQVIATGGKVTPVGETAGGMLGAEGAIGALLRW